MYIFKHRLVKQHAADANRWSHYSNKKKIRWKVVSLWLKHVHKGEEGWGYSNIKLLGQERIPFTPSCQLQNILKCKKKSDNDIKEIKKNPTNFAKFVISVVWTGNDCIPTIHLGYIYRCIGRGVSLCSSNYPKIWNSSSTCTAGIPGNRSTHTDPSRSACAHINRNKSNITSV